MPTEEALRNRIVNLIVTHRKKLELAQHAVDARMDEAYQRGARFIALAPRILRGMVEPRLQAMASHFDDAVCSPCDSTWSVGIVCNRKRRVPATVSVSFCLECDEQEIVRLRYRPNILPILMPFQKEDALAFPLDQPDEARIVEFVEAKIVQFVETYLRLLRSPAYRVDNLAVDPVCGMKVDRWNAAGQVEHAGTIYYFCCGECAAKFRDHPRAATL